MLQSLMTHEEKLEFYRTITRWLLPLGYKEIYNNIGWEQPLEHHFIKEGIRVICVTDSERYCKLHTDQTQQRPYGVSLVTGRYKIGTNELPALHANMLVNIAKINKKSLWKQFLSMLK